MKGPSGACADSLKEGRSAFISFARLWGSDVRRLRLLLRSVTPLLVASQDAFKVMPAHLKDLLAICREISSRGERNKLRAGDRGVRERETRQGGAVEQWSRGRGLTEPRPAVAEREQRQSQRPQSQRQTQRAESLHPAVPTPFTTFMSQVQYRAGRIQNNAGRRFGGHTEEAALFSSLLLLLRVSGAHDELSSRRRAEPPAVLVGVSDLLGPSSAGGRDDDDERARRAIIRTTRAPTLVQGPAAAKC
ncbi:unnamed protein product [Lampetra fluviatilis]